VGRGTRGADLLRAGEFARLAEAGGDAERVELVDQVADGRAGTEPGRGVALAALGRDPELVDGARLALQLGRVLHQLGGRTARTLDRLQIAVGLDVEALDRLARGRDAVHHAARPFRLDADH